MITLRFLVDVPDKYTREEYKEGQEVKFKDERAKEILAARQPNGQPYVEVTEDEVEITEENIIDGKDLKEDEIIEVKAKKTTVKKTAAKKTTTRKKK